MPTAPLARTSVRRPSRGWPAALGLAVLVGLVALASNATTQAQLAGHADRVLAARLTVSKVVNSGTVWGGLSFVAGWLVQTRRWSWLAGVLAGELALVTHYAVGQVVGMFDGAVWSSNAPWFAAALVMGLPLGRLGALARRPGTFGGAAALTLPLAAVAEPWVMRMFHPVPQLPWPDRWSSVACGAILTVGGVVAAAAVSLRRRALADSGMGPAGPHEPDRRTPQPR